MPRFLVDTNVLSNRRDAEGERHVAIWFQRYASLIRVSVVTVAADSDEATIKAAALADAKVHLRIAGKIIVKLIVVPGKLVNLVVK